MTISRHPGYVVRGLAADTKPTTGLIAGLSTFEEWDTGKKYLWSGTTWIRPDFQKLKEYKIFKVGSTTYVTDGNDRIANSNTDTKTAVQAVLDALVTEDVARFRWDSAIFGLSGPILPPKSITNGTRIYVDFQGYYGDQTDIGTVLEPLSSFPTQRCAIECETSLVATNETSNFRCNGIHFNGRPFAKSWSNPGFNIFGTTPVIEFGGIKLSHATHSFWSQVTDCRFTYPWRGLWLLGQVWFNTFRDFWFNAPSVNFDGDACILLENGGHANPGTNPTVKQCEFSRMRGAFSGVYDAFLKMKSGNYNYFQDFFPDGITYRTAPFTLDNSDISLDAGYIMSGNRFYSMQVIDLHTNPTPDTRKAALYLNGLEVRGNTFKESLLPNYPDAIRITGGAQNNNIELVGRAGTFSDATRINDAGAGLWNTVSLIEDFSSVAPLGIVSTNGIVRIIDRRGIAFNGGDELISDGTHWWLKGAPSMLSKRKWGGHNIGTANLTGFGICGTWTAATGAGSTALANDNTNGRHISCPTGVTSGNKGGIRVAASLFSSNMDPKVRFRIKPVDTTNMRLYVGLCSNFEPTGDDPLGAGQVGILFGYRSTDTNFQWMRNNTTGATAFTDTGIAKNADMRDVRIVVTDNGTKFHASLDGGAYTVFTTEIPSATNVLTPMCQSETSENVAKTFQLYSAFMQTEK